MTQADGERASELEEIGRLARELNYIDGDDRTVYEDLIGSYFSNAKSARELKDYERIEWLTMLRLWRQGSMLPPKTAADINEDMIQRRSV